MLFILIIEAPPPAVLEFLKQMCRREVQDYVKKKIVEHFEQTPTRTFLSNEVQSDSHVSRSMHCNILKKVVINEKYGVCCMKNILGKSFIIVDLFYVLDISTLSLVFVS